MNRAEAIEAARTLAGFLKIPLHELLEDARAGRLLRNAAAAPKGGRDFVKAAKRLRAGDQVFDESDPRHIGRIKIVHNPQVRGCETATVVWRETGWVTEGIPLSNLRRTK